MDWILIMYLFDGEEFVENVLKIRMIGSHFYLSRRALISSFLTAF